MQTSRMQTAVKALLLIGLGLFLYSRIVNGTLFYYINERFAGFTVLAVFGLILVGLSYRVQQPTPTEQCEEAQGHAHDHTHRHEHHHSHAIGWGGALLVLLPIILGLVTPPQPLGAAALANRDINLATNNSALPAAVRQVEKTAEEKNIMDWWHDFRKLPDVNTALVGQSVRVSGFVYKDKRFGENHFLVMRFVVSCCVADANVLGLLVDGGKTTNLENDQWVEVAGVFASSDLPNWKLPIVINAQVVQAQPPNQPYLYP